MTEPVTNQPPQRQKRIMELDEVLAKVKDGMTIGIGGFINSSHPMLVVRGLIKRGIKNLTVAGAASSGLEIDLLIAAGCVAKVVAPYVGGEALSPIGPAFRAAVEKGRVEVFELDEAMYYAALRAAAQRVPFNPWRSGVGTSFPEVNPAIKVFRDPINGETLLAIPALNFDIAFLHAAVSDPYGNVQYVGHGYGDRAIYAAADQTYVQVEQVVSNEEIRKDPLKTAIPGADGVIRARFGAHPYSSPGHYIEDQEHIKQYVRAATAWAKDNDFGPLKKYLDDFVTGPADHPAYLERIGIRRLLALNEY
ncbi:MAG: CoA transferase subunit A [Betaproteobacteria bacterium]|nr:CoA transferase subunit A [Betaproteobacteria bacterium]